MEFSAKPVTVAEIRPWRDLYRQEMNCQIVHDSMHARAGWAQPYLIEAAGTPAGYGSLLVGGQWEGTRTIFEYYVTPRHRSRVFDLFDCLRTASEATAVKAQTNDALLTVMLHAFAHNITAEKIVFEDKLTTAHAIEGVTLRHRPKPEDDWVLESDGIVAATGGIMYHYNRPYGDIYMAVAEPFRQRGLGCYIVQELKRICYELGSIPCARCNPDNLASRKTLQKAGFVPCATILTGVL
jgi:RimJ/RimL family protein N-acetyltransferase